MTLPSWGARELQDHPTSGSYAALGMSLNGIATALLVPVIVAVVRWLGAA